MVAPIKPSPMPLGKAVDKYLNALEANVSVGARSEGTLNTYAQNLGFMVRHFGSETLVDDITGEDIDTLLVSYARSGDMRTKNPTAGKRRKSASSQRIFRAALSAFFNDTVHRGWCQVSPLEFTTVQLQKPSTITRSPAREALTAEQAQALLNVGLGSLREARSSSAMYRYYLNKAVITTLLFTGLRSSELCSLDWEDFVSRDGARFVRVIGKGGRQRDVPIDEGLWSVLNTWRAMFEAAVKRHEVEPDAAAQGAVFVSSYGKRITGKYVRRALERARARVGSDPSVSHLSRAVVPHGLRHTAGTLWLASGEADLAQIRDLLGHSNISTTSLYMHSDKRSLVRVVGSSGLSLDDETGVVGNE